MHEIKKEKLPGMDGRIDVYRLKRSEEGKLKMGVTVGEEKEQGREGR